VAGVVGRRVMDSKNKCVCEWLKEQSLSASFKDNQDNQCNRVVLKEDTFRESTLYILIEHLPTLNNWRISALEHCAADVYINYCPFCGRKLN
jgi:hypothetical protein